MIHNQRDTREEDIQMSKIGKKLNMVLIALGILFLLPTMVTHAADGTLQFSDPTGKVGEEITVKVKMDAGGVAIGDGDAELTYDTEKLEFVSGTNASGGNGTVTLSASGTGSETELNFELVFKALSEGSTNIQVSSSTAYLFSDETLHLQHGTSAITIEAGDGTSNVIESRTQGSPDIKISGTLYAIYENFTDALIPSGFSKTKVEYNGVEYNGVTQDISGKNFLFLVEGSDDPVMALCEDDNSLTLAEPVSVTEDFYILVLAKGDGSILPESFVETTLELNGTIFPAWQNMDSQEYYVMYALSSNGDEGFYQYDKKDGTYQRYVVQQREEEPTESPVPGKIKSLIEQNFMIIVAAIAVIVLLLIIIVIVQAVKLGHRNAELDELYDEYVNGDNQPAVNEKSQKQFVGFDDDNDDGDDLNDEFIEDDFDGDFEDSYENDYVDDEDNAYTNEPYDDEEYYYDDDEYYDDDDGYYDEDSDYDEDGDYDEDSDDDIRFIDL